MKRWVPSYFPLLHTFVIKFSKLPFPTRGLAFHVAFQCLTFCSGQSHIEDREILSGRAEISEEVGPHSLHWEARAAGWRAAVGAVRTARKQVSNSFAIYPCPGPRGGQPSKVRCSDDPSEMWEYNVELDCFRCDCIS